LIVAGVSKELPVITKEIRKISVLLASAALVACASTANPQPAQSLAPQSAPAVSAPSMQTPAPTTPAPSTEPTAPEQTPAQPPSEAAQDPTSQTSSYSDAQLRSFVEASEEVQPLTQGLAEATPDVRARNTEAIRAALQRHGLDGQTYNNIATAAQSDSALAARIASLQQAETTQDSTPATPPGGN
jgi:hypothetical protein